MYCVSLPSNDTIIFRGVFEMNAYRELTPVNYGNSSINHLHFRFTANEMCVSAHWHDRIELLQIVSGSLDVYLNDVHSCARPGDIVIILPNTIHCVFAGNGGADYHVIAFDPKKYCNGTPASEKYMQPLLLQEAAFCPVTNHPEIAETIEELIDLLLSPKEHNPLYAMGKIYELIGLFHQYCTIDPTLANKPDERFGAVLSYINSNYTESISARDISKIFGYEESYFCRRFKSATGISTTKYIRFLRMEKAQSLLRTSKESIQSIALKCGFSDICYFSNCFKRQFGVSPTEFRERET